MLDLKLVGFISYQVDTPLSDCLGGRGLGSKLITHGDFGSKLITHPEKVLYDRGAECIYLTSDAPADFWELRGYTKTGKVSDINQDPIYEKPKRGE